MTARHAPEAGGQGRGNEPASGSGMAVWWTATVGAVLWWMASGISDTRVAMGRGGPWIYLAVWLWLVLALIWHDRVKGRTAGGTRIPIPAVRGIIIGLPLVAALGWVIDASHVGDSPVSGWITGLFMLFLILPLVVVMAVAAMRRARGRSASAPRATAQGAAHLLRALAPLLVPLAALVSLHFVPVPTWWEARVAATGRVGVLYGR